jgi:ubiquinone/menaquinone biosynthesis C-methylase UbiE
MKVNTTYEPYSQEPEYIETNKDLLATLTLDSVHTVLDLACGTGLLTDLLLGFKPNLVVYGVDLSAESLGIARKVFRQKGLLVETEAEIDAARKAGKGAVMFMEGSADALQFAPGRFELAMMGNAIHLMKDKDAFLQGVHRVLAPGGRFIFNSVFFTGTFVEGTERLYSEWMKEAVVILNEKNEALKKEGKPPIPRKRGTAGRAFDKGWLSAQEWQQTLERNGFIVERNYLRPVPISQRGLELVGAYGGLAEVLMSGYPVEVSSECLQLAAVRAFSKLGLKEVSRNWLEISAVKK